MRCSSIKKRVIDRRYWRGRREDSEDVVQIKCMQKACGGEPCGLGYLGVHYFLKNSNTGKADECLDSISIINGIFCDINHCILTFGLLLASMTFSDQALEPLGGTVWVRGCRVRD